MAMGSAARPLLVPAADLLAKNMRALDTANAPTSTFNANANNASFLSAAGVDSPATEARKRVRFRRALDDSQPSAIAALLARLLPRKKSKAKRSAEEKQRKAEKSQLQKTLQKLLPMLEKASAIASRLPDPTVLFLALVLAVLVVDMMRPQWFDSIVGKLVAIVAFVPLFVLALLWRRTELFAKLREGLNPLTHPTDHRLDEVEADLKRREEFVKEASETLEKNRAQLDALRKELAKDPHAHEPDAVIVPSRKAAMMIAAGALGAGFDSVAAHAVEQRRREESVQKSWEEWRARAEETEVEVEQTKESMKLLADHAASAYTKRTREVKSRTVGGGPKGLDRVVNLRKIVNVVKRDEDSDDAPPRMSRNSEQSGAVSVNSNSSRKRLLPFRWKKRESNVSVPAAFMAADARDSNDASGLTPIEEETTTPTRKRLSTR